VFALTHTAFAGSVESVALPRDRCSMSSCD
jgi:hypothetical protein